MKLQRKLIAMVMSVWVVGAVHGDENPEELFERFLAEEMKKEQTLEKRLEAGEITREFIYNEGIRYNSGLWNQLKTGNYATAGRSRDEWKSYLTEIGRSYNYVLSNLKEPISNKLEEYSLFIKTSHRGGFWMMNEPYYVKKWDNKSDWNDVAMSGVLYGYNDEPVNRNVIVHEAGHGLFELYGSYASEENRLINLEQFRKDTERFVGDENAESYYMNILKNDWGVGEKTSEEIRRLSCMFPGEFKEGDVIGTDCSERFASLIELYMAVDGVLPEYITKHFDPFFKKEFVESRMNIPRFMKEKENL